MLSIEKITAKRDKKKKGQRNPLQQTNKPNKKKQTQTIKECLKGKILRAQSSYLLFHLYKCPSGSQ